MHGSLREGLESLLAAKPSNEVVVAVNHVAGCKQCSDELTAMRAQAELFRTLKTPEEVEPSPGFYARVIQRIEQSAKRSIWWVFVYSPIGKRLAYSSLTVALALGSYVFAAEAFDGHLGAAAITTEPQHTDAMVVGSPENQRQAVLANFIAHHIEQPIDQPLDRSVDQPVEQSPSFQQ